LDEYRYFRGMIIILLRLFSGLSHLAYGILALTMAFYIEEFVRYGFADLRIAIAVAQILGGAGLLLFKFSPRTSAISACLLAIMMAGALATRVSIQDSLEKSLPALIYLLINSFIFMKSLNNFK